MIAPSACLLFPDAVQRNGHLAELLQAAEATPTVRTVFSPHEVPPGQGYKTRLVEVYGISTGIADARLCHPCVPLHPIWLANELAMYLDRENPRLAALTYLPREEALRFHALDGDRIVRHYGYSIGNIGDIVEQLHVDPETKRAIVSFQEPAWRGVDATESPCAIATQYLLRDGRLWTISGFRSHDFFAGGRMDPIRIGLVQQAIARILEVECGPLIIQDGSLHYYPDRKHGALADEIYRGQEMGMRGTVTPCDPRAIQIAPSLDFFTDCPPARVLDALGLFVDAFRTRFVPPVLRRYARSLARLVDLANARANGSKVWA